MDSQVPSSPAPRALRGAFLEDALRELAPVAPVDWTLESGVFDRPPSGRKASVKAREAPALAAVDEEPGSAGPPAMRPEQLARWRGTVATAMDPRSPPVFIV